MSARAHAVALVALIAGLAACTMPKKAPTQAEMDASPGGSGHASAAPLPLPPSPAPMRPAPAPEARAAFVVPPKPRVRPAPQYPDALSTQGIGGRVMVRFTVDALGHVRELKVVQSPHPQLTQAVQAALANWRFEPALDASGQPVPASTQQSFQFHAQE